jgi:hypothetical protein
MHHRWWNLHRSNCICYKVAVTPAMRVKEARTLKRRLTSTTWIRDSDIKRPCIAYPVSRFGQRSPYWRWPSESSRTYGVERGIEIAQHKKPTQMTSINLHIPSTQHPENLAVDYRRTLLERSKTSCQQQGGATAMGRAPTTYLPLRVTSACTGDTCTRRSSLRSGQHSLMKHIRCNLAPLTNNRIKSVIRR